MLETHHKLFFIQIPSGNNQINHFLLFTMIVWELKCYSNIPSDGNIHITVGLLDKQLPTNNKHETDH